MLYLDLYIFKNGDGRMTPVLYYDKKEMSHWYFDFYASNFEHACRDSGLDPRSETCQTLKDSFVGNTVLNCCLIVATFFTVASAILVVCMFH